MKLTKKQEAFVLKNNVVILATADKKGQPRCVFVECNKAKGEELVITDNCMKITKQNFLANKKVFVLAFSKDFSKRLNIKGKLVYHDRGKYLDWVAGLETNKNWQPKGALVVKIEKIA